jgi:predicted Zn-dependent protease
VTDEVQPAACPKRESELLDRAQSALQSAPGDGALLLVYASSSALTRFTANHIHQNVATDNVGVTAKVLLGDRVGVASTNALEARALKRVLKQAAEVARSLGRPSEQAVLAPPRLLPRPLPESDHARTHWQPRARALAVKGIVKRAAKAKTEAAGALSESCDVFAVANTLGVALATTLSQAELNLVVSKGQGTGFAYAVARYPDELPLGMTAERALEKCLLNQDPVDLPAGDYTTILEPDAVGELVSFLGYLGFGAKAVQEGRSFVCGKLGQAITGDRFTLWDDGWDAAGLPLPFDFEGVPKEKVTLIDRGVARSVVYDTTTARKDNVSSTGHALGPGSTSGPMPLNLFVAPGDSSLAEMVSGTERGLLVTRFHYTNVVERMRAVLTGMTRDGTFLIEDGRISKPVKNFRFTESVLEAFSRIEAVSRERRLVQGPVLAPAIKVRDFRFSGTTEF